MTDSNQEFNELKAKLLSHLQKSLHQEPEFDEDGGFEKSYRDGLALYWAERYMHQKTFCEKKLIIVLSDGQPAHAYDDYYGYVAHNDTANAVKKILKRGTSVIAVALDNDCENDDADSTFNDLKDIYPHLIQCKDLKRLTGQILQIVSKQLL